ncbi:Phage protein Gp37/Gp68 [compost metagenome]
MNPQWPAEIQRQCRKARVPFHFKQWGHWAPLELMPDLVTKRTPIYIIQEGHKEVSVAALGKTKTGRHLAGRVWDEFPQTLA